MSHSNHFTKDNIDEYLRELGKVFRKKNGTKTPAELIVVGGAAVLINYNFRESTQDIDAIIHASSVMKEAIFELAEVHGWTDDWLNDDFHYTPSFTSKLNEVSQYYRTFSNVLEIRTVSAEYLVAMKLMSGRDRKNDLSDIIGIINESRMSGNPIGLENIQRAVTELYGSWDKLSDFSRNFIDRVYLAENLAQLYNEVRYEEKDNREEFERSDAPRLYGIQAYIAAHQSADEDRTESNEQER